MIRVIVFTVITAIGVYFLQSNRHLFIKQLAHVPAIERIAEAAAKQKWPETASSSEWQTTDPETLTIDADDQETAAALASGFYVMQTRRVGSTTQWRIGCAPEHDALSIGEFQPVRTPAGWTLPPDTGKKPAVPWALVSRTIAEEDADGTVTIRTVSYWARPLIMFILCLGMFGLIRFLADRSKKIRHYVEPLALPLAYGYLVSIALIVYLSFGWRVTVKPDGSVEGSKWGFGIPLMSCDVPPERVVAVVGKDNVNIIWRDEEGAHEILPVDYSPADEAPTIAGMVARNLARRAPKQDPPSVAPN
jgi:hypothetical protein